jgi:type IV pilus assembly protein PilB
MTLSDDQLLKILKDLKYLPAHKLEEIQDVAEENKSSLFSVLVQRDYLTKDELGNVSALYYQLPYVSLSKTNIPSELLRMLPENVAKEHQTVVFQLEDNILHIATAKPDATDLFKMLTIKAGAKKYILSYATEEDIESALHLFKPGFQNILDGLIKNSLKDAQPIAELVDRLFEYAYDAKASDIHIEPLHNETVLRFRIDGVLHDEAVIPKALHEQLVARLKVMARLRTDEHLSAQDGRLKLSLKDQELSVRISIVPLVRGEKVVMRLLSRHTQEFNLPDLGMSEDDLDLVQEGFNRPFGMILSTGPTGSGKTTTIYAILKILNTRTRNIATIEDPVEYEVEGVNQVQANLKTNLTFGEGLRTLLRQDPDILFVGEIRDEETAGITVNAAMTGHLVLSTMHTNDAVTTLPRLVDMGIEPYLVSSTVNIIIGQRLVRQICSHCKSSLKLVSTEKGWDGDPAQSSLLDIIPRSVFVKHFGNKNTVRVYSGVGCSACHNTGYQGRVGIFEVLEITPQLAQLISAKADSDKLLAQAIKDGMTTMLDDGLDKVLNGETTLSEIMRVTKI